jgi:glycosyltransferase involved in cell wall biosynthesis
VKILYHHRTLGDGAEGIHIASMVAAFRNLGHEVRVVSMIGTATNVSTARTRRLSAFIRWIPRAAYEALEFLYSFAGYLRLVSEIRRWQPDLLYERYALFNLAGVMAARRTAIPLVLEVNAPLAWERAQYEQLTMRRLARACERLVCRSADLVEAVSTPLKEHLLAIGVSRDRITVVPNGADPAVFTPDADARRDVRARLGIPDDCVVIGFSGILRPWHGAELLIDAVAALRARRDVRLLFVGDGPSRASLESRARAHGLQTRVIVTGRLPHDEIPRYIAAFDIGVSPRTTFYASPMKVPEYMAAGVAVVAPRSANLVDLIADTRDGLLFAPDDAADLAETLRRLVDDPATRAVIGHAARETVLARRTWWHNAGHVIERAQELVACA